MFSNCAIVYSVMCFFKIYQRYKGIGIQWYFPGLVFTSSADFLRWFSTLSAHSEISLFVSLARFRYW